MNATGRENLREQVACGLIKAGVIHVQVEAALVRARAAARECRIDDAIADAELAAALLSYLRGLVVEAKISPILGNGEHLGTWFGFIR